MVDKSLLGVSKVDADMKVLSFGSLLHTVPVCSSRTREEEPEEMGPDEPAGMQMWKRRDKWINANELVCRKGQRVCLLES